MKKTACLSTAFIGLLLAVLAQEASAQVNLWQGGTGNWFVSSNWTAGVPNSSYNVAVREGGIA